MDFRARFVKWPWWGLGLLFVGGCAHSPLGSSKDTSVANLVLVSGRVLDLERSDPVATAIAIHKGRIIDLGDDQTIRTYVGEDSKVVDLKGKTVLPGLVDSHIDLAELAVRRSGIDLVGTRSIREVQSRIKKAVAKTPRGTWIRGRGWDERDWTPEAEPTARDLDEIAPHHPVVLTRIHGETIWVNTAAMKRARSSEFGRWRGQGAIIKRRGRPSGLFRGDAKLLILDHVPRLVGSQLENALLRAQKECLAAGLTQVHAMGISRETRRALEALDKQRTLIIRTYAFLNGNTEDLGALIAPGPKLIPPGDPSRLTIRGVAFFLDGGFETRGAALLAPYNDRPKNYGELAISPNLLEARIRTVTTRGFQVATTAVGDRATRVSLDIYERALGDNIRTLRPRIEHVRMIHPQDIARFGKLGTIASIQPAHAVTDRRWVKSRLGQDRLLGVHPWQSLLRSHTLVTAGSDAPNRDVSPMLGLYTAITRKDMFGLPKKGWQPRERMTRTQAVRALTSAGAYASFRESVAGRIKKGYVADLTVVDRDPLTATEAQLASAQIHLTIVDGKIEFTRPEHAAP